MLLLVPLERQLGQGQPDILYGLCARGACLSLTCGQEPLLSGHGQEFLELLQGLRKGRRGQVEDLRELLGLPGTAGFLQNQIHTPAQHGIPTESLTPSDLLDGNIHVPAGFNGGLIESMVQADER